MLAEMKHVRDDVKELKDTLKEELPDLRKRVSDLETDQKVWKARVSTATAIATVCGGGAVWLMEHVLLK